MVKTLGLASVLALSLASTAAFAQSAPATSPDAPMQSERLNTAPAPTTQGQQPETTTMGTLTYIPQQMTGEVLSSTLISKAVHNPQNEELGTINQLIMNTEGQVVAVVIGVGGFLGMGEKDIAVPFTSLQQTMEGGTHRITIQATKADLEKAPAYKTLEDRG